MTDELLAVTDLTVDYEVKSASGKRLGTVQAVKGVSLSIRPGEIVGLVGESGCGKSTLGKAIMGLVRPSGGGVEVRSNRSGQVIPPGSGLFRKAVQMVFQDPYSALNPKRRVLAILDEARRVQGNKDKQINREAILDQLERMGFGEEALYRYPHQFSGGQLQRIGIARAIINDPELVICDEPVSALDVSIQSQILNLLGELQKEHDYSYLFISHDLGVVQYIADRILVMYLGEIVEELPPQDLAEDPKHPYTQMLAAAIPGRGESKMVRSVKGELPSPLNPPSGCTFHPRCPFAMEICRTMAPSPTDISQGRRVSCHLYPSATDARQTSTTGSEES